MSHVLVTGCSTGIGLATALTLARSGHTVCATMRNLDRGSFLRETLETEKLSVLMLPLDVDSVGKQRRHRAHWVNRGTAAASVPCHDGD